MSTSIIRVTSIYEYPALRNKPDAWEVWGEITSHVSGKSVIGKHLVLWTYDPTAADTAEIARKENRQMVVNWYEGGQGPKIVSCELGESHAA